MRLQLSLEFCGLGPARLAVRAQLLMLLLLLTLAPVPGASADFQLPTPPEHYETYDVQVEARQLGLKILASLPEEQRNIAMAMLQSAEGSDARSYTTEDALLLLQTVDWQPYRDDLIRLLLHGSRVMEAVPEGAATWRPLVHDGFLLFLDELSEERLVERFVAQINLPKDAPRGDRMLAFVTNTPSLQKLAQIVARNPGLDADVRASLQTLENSISTSSIEEIRARVYKELDDAVVQEYGIEVSEDVLGEASVGAVIRGSFAPPGSEIRQPMACKVLKPYAIANMKEDLEIIDTVLAYLERHGDSYDIGDTPLVDIFREIREALTREVQVENEQSNLVRAYEYYLDQPEVVVPKLYPFSTPHVSCMDLISGVKITDAFPGDPAERAEMARRLSDALTYGVIFSRKELAIFHGDPHAGNVFHVEPAPEDPSEGTNGDRSVDAEDPYRIALLDWGLSADFTREERAQLIQLLLGLYLNHPKRIANNVGVLVEWEAESDEDRVKMLALVKQLMADSEADAMFAFLDELVTGLARYGYAIRYDAAIFIKSQLTIYGILQELDPEFEQDDYLMQQLSSQVLKETHTRLLRTVYFPAWNSHSYTSMMSNEDVKDVQLKRLGGAFKAMGRGIWWLFSFKWAR